MNENRSESGKNKGIIVFAYFALSLLCALHYSAGFSVFSVLGILSLALFSVLYSIIISYGFLPYVMAVPVLAFAAIPVFSGSGSDVFGSAVNVLLCLVCALCLSYCAKIKQNKAKTYAALCTAASAGIIADVLIFIWRAFGNIRPETLKTAVETAASYVGETYRNIFDIISENAAYDAQTLDYVEEFIQTSEYYVKVNAVSSLVIFGMLLSALAVALYGFFCKISGMKNECIGGRDWTFSMSPLGARFLYISYAAYFIFDFFVGNNVLSAAFYNVSTILSIPFAYLGIKSVYGFFALRIRSRALAVIAVAALAFLLIFILGMNTVVIILSFIGASSTVRRSYAPKNPL